MFFIFFILLQKLRMTRRRGERQAVGNQHHWFRYIWVDAVHFVFIYSIHPLDLSTMPNHLVYNYMI